MSGSDQEAEPGARLTCHLLLRLFSSTSLNNLMALSSTKQPTPQQPGSTPHGSQGGSTSGVNIKLSCDKHLLTAAHGSITVGAVVAVLKALLMLGECLHAFWLVVHVISLAQSEIEISTYLNKYFEHNI